MNFGDGADGACLYQFHHAPIVAGGVDLVTHLRGAVIFFCGCGHDAGFGNGVSERFFTINVVPALQCGDSGHSMGVVGGADDLGINAGLFQKLPLTVVSACAWEFLLGGAQEFFVNVAQGDDVLLGHALDV